MSGTHVAVNIVVHSYANYFIFRIQLKYEFTIKFNQRSCLCKMSWSTERKTFCVETYIDTKFIKTVQSKFRRRFDFNHFPTKSMIYRWVKKFKSEEIVLQLSAKSEKVTTGRHLSVRFPGNVDAVRTSVCRSPQKSIERRSREHL